MSKDPLKGLNEFLDGVERLKRADDLLHTVWRILGPYASFHEQGLRTDTSKTPVITVGHLGCSSDKEFSECMNKLHSYFKFDDSE